MAAAGEDIAVDVGGSEIGRSGLDAGRRKTGGAD